MNKEEVLKKYDERIERNKKLASILKPLIKNLLNSKGVKFQSVSTRLKTRNSLEKNFSGDEYKGRKLKKFEDIPDIVGCRVVFYSDSDLNRFTELVKKNFPIIASKNKMFDKGYKGHNITCTLGKRRERLSEYSKISGIIFEVQATTVFYHGWNELEHDIFYKDKKLVRENFPHQFEELKKISIDLSKKLAEIQKAWENITFQYDIAANGGKVFRISAFEECAKLSDNNQIYDFINNLNAFISGNGSLPANLDIKKVLQQIVLIAKKSMNNKVAPEKTILGMWPGKTSGDIVHILLQTFSCTFYKYYEYRHNTIEALIEIYTDNPKEDKIEEWFRENSKYKYSILKERGYEIQTLLLNLAEKWIKNNQKSLYNLIFPITKSVLGPDFSGSRRLDSKTIELQSGGLNSDKNIRRIRTRALIILKELYQKSKSNDQKLKVIDAFDVSTRISDYGGTIDEIVKDNVHWISKFYCDILTNSPMQVLLEMEKSLLWAKKCFPKETFENINTFSTQLKSNKDYEIYKILVGHDLHSELEEEVYIKEKKKKESDKIKNLFRKINNKNIQRWERLLTNIGIEIDNYRSSNDYKHFYDLLKEIGKNSHTLAWRLIRTNKFKSFKECLVAGLILSKNKHQKTKIDNWVKKSVQGRKYLYIIIRAYAISGEYNKRNLKEFTGALIKKRGKEEKAKILWNLFHMINFEEKYASSTLDAIEIANNIGYYEWTETYSNKNKIENNFFSSLKKSDWDKIKETIVNKDRINCNDEQILEKLIEKFPKDFVDVFKQRIAKKSRMKYYGKYESIPHKMYYLEKNPRQVLTKNSKTIIDRSFYWLNKDYSTFGLFLKTTYPNQNPYLEKRLNSIIDLNDKEKWTKFVLPYLKTNRGFEIEEYIKRTIRKLDEDTEIWNFCRICLLNTGSLTGDMSESIVGRAYSKILEEIKNWKENNRKINKFKKKCINDLEARIKIADHDHSRILQNMKLK